MEKITIQSKSMGRMKKDKIQLHIILIFLVGIFGTSTCEQVIHNSPSHKDGILDIRYYDLNLHPEPIPMEGEWLFYWEEFIYSKPPTTLADPITVLTQESWMGKEVKGFTLPKFGYGTFYTNILLPVDSTIPKLAISIPQIASSYRLYINRVLVYSNGVAGRSREESSPYIRNHYLPIQLSSMDRNIEIAFEVSNYENNAPGFWQVPRIGLLDRIYKIQLYETASELFLFGALFIMGFYHAGIFFHYRSQKSLLYFSLFAFLLTFRVFITGERYILELFPQLDWSLLFRLEFLNLYTIPIVFLFYIYYLFPRETNKLFIYVVTGVVFFFCITLIFPIHVFTQYLMYFQLVLAISGIYVLILNGIAVIRKRPDSFTFLTGLFVLVATGIWDIIQDFRNIRGIAISPYGFLVFVFIQAIVLSSRLAANFTRTKKISKSLSISNKELTELKSKLEIRVEERTRKLKNTLEDIQKDLVIAKNIQSKIIPQNRIIWENLEVSSLYKPMDEVGGDIFDVTEFTQNKKRIFLADALGHGVQAALFTMAIKSEYEGVKHISFSPSDLIRNLSDSFLKKFSSLNTYFSCVVIDIDLDENYLIFSSAGHPSQVLIQNGQLIELVRTSHIIGLDRRILVTETKLKFEPGNRIFLFSDGAFEVYNKDKIILGAEVLYKTLVDSTMLGDKLPTTLLKADILVSEYLGELKLQDDLTIVGIEYYI